MYPPATYETKDGRSVTVRLTSPSDYDETIETWRSVTAERIYLMSEAVRSNTKETWTERWVSNGEDSLFAIAIVNGKIAGGIVLTKLSEWEKNRHVRDLGIWITKEYRGAGVGGALIDYAIDWARKNGTIRKIVLEVYANNTAAINRYLHSNFKIEGARRDVALIDGKYVDEINMGLDI